MTHQIDQFTKSYNAMQNPDVKEVPPLKEEKKNTNKLRSTPVIQNIIKTNGTEAGKYKKKQTQWLPKRSQPSFNTTPHVLTDQTDTRTKKTITKIHTDHKSFLEKKDRPVTQVHYENEKKLKNINCIPNEIINEYLNKNLETNSIQEILSHFSKITDSMKIFQDILIGWKCQSIANEIILSTITKEEHDKISKKLNNTDNYILAIQIEKQFFKRVEKLEKIQNMIVSLSLKGINDIFLELNDIYKTPFDLLVIYIKFSHIFLQCAYFDCQVNENKKIIFLNHLEGCFHKLNQIVKSYKKIEDQFIKNNLPYILFYQQRSAFDYLTTMFPQTINFRNQLLTEERTALSTIQWSLTENAIAIIKPHLKEEVDQNILFLSKKIEETIHDYFCSANFNYNYNEYNQNLKRLFANLIQSKLSTDEYLSRLLANLNAGECWIEMKQSAPKSHDLGLSFVEDFKISIENYLKDENIAVSQSKEPSTPFDFINDHIRKLFMLCHNHPDLIHSWIVDNTSKRFLRITVFKIDAYLPIIAEIVNNYEFMIAGRHSSFLPCEPIQDECNKWRKIFELTQIRIAKFHNESLNTMV